MAVTLNAPPTLTRDFLTVLSGIDEFLMARLIRAQTADGVTIIEFLDDVMQDRTDGFKTHHRIAAAKELIVHIVRDEQPSHTPSPSTTPSPLTGEGWGEGDSPVVPAPTTVVPAKAGTQGGGGGRSTAANSAHPEPSSTVIPAKAGIQRGGGRTTPANPAHPEPVLSTVEGPSSIVVPAKAGTHPRDPEPGSQLETKNSKLRTLPARRTRTQRRRDGNARAAIRRKALGSERIEEEKDENPPPRSSPPPSAESTKNSNSTGTSRTPGPDPSTPHTPAAHPPDKPQPDYTTE